LLKEWNFRVNAEHSVKWFLHCAADVLEGRVVCVHWRVQAAIEVG